MTVAERLHALVESAVKGWLDSLPAPRAGDSTALRQDRLTAHDLIRQADRILREEAPQGTKS